MYRQRLGRRTVLAALGNLWCKANLCDMPRARAREREDIHSLICRHTHEAMTMK